LGNLNNDQLISQPFSVAINSKGSPLEDSETTTPLVVYRLLNTGFNNISGRYNLIRYGTLRCDICPNGLGDQRRTFWKYNFLQLMIGEHLTENGTLPSCRAQLVVESHLTLLEEFWV
jgi:hypothetical protein